MLFFNALNEMRKVRSRGNKDGAREAWQCLQEAGLGTFTTRKAARGTAQVGMHNQDKLYYAYLVMPTKWKSDNTELPYTNISVQPVAAL